MDELIDKQNYYIKNMKKMNLKLSLKDKQYIFKLKH